MNKAGDGRRVARVEKEIQHVVAQYVLSGIKVSLPGIVTISQVKMPADLRAAKVYVSVLGEDRVRENVVEILQSKASEIQKYIGDQLKMRYCPRLTFYIDKTTEQVMKMEQIFHEINQERKTRDGNSDEQ